MLIQYLDYIPYFQSLLHPFCDHLVASRLQSPTILNLNLVIIHYKQLSSPLAPSCSGEAHLVREAVQDPGGTGEAQGWSEVQRGRSNVQRRQSQIWGKVNAINRGNGRR